MIDLSLRMCFVLTLLNGIFFGITLNSFDWSVFETGVGIREEIQLPLILFILSVVFFIKYMKKLKEEKAK
jgi:hypothetical protein